MSWLKREKEGILTGTHEKTEAPDGLWHKCAQCKTTTHIRELRANMYVCPACDFHNKLGSAEYFTLFFDNGKFEELDANLVSANPLGFTDTKEYPKRLADVQKKTGLKDALRSATGKVGGIPLTIACMDFSFIGGSMGSVVGEKIARAIVYAMEHEQPFLMISKSGGARMMEGALSLMQMAKTSARLAQLAEKGLPYISLLTDPTTGGVTASYAMLGDFNIAEPNALIGFAGPRVIRETIGKDLPDGFQSSEFLLEHGFVDTIVHRHDLKEQVVQLLSLVKD